MSLVRLIVLGIVALDGEAHGYAVRRKVGEWRVDSWTRVQPGSIYHALKQLARDGRLRALAAEESAEGPDRVRYRLTEVGRAEFVERLEAALGSFDIEALGVGVAFMDALPKTRVAALLDDQMLRARANVAHLRELRTETPGGGPAPHTRDLLDLWIGNLDATTRWVEGIRKRLGPA